MITNEQVKQFDEIIRNTESILVVYPKHPSIDVLATAMAVYTSLVAQGKRVSVSSPEVPEQSGQLNNSDITKTVTEIGNQNLVISFDYSEEAIDKVSYHIGEDTKKFYLTIKPKAGYPPLDAENVDFSYTGVEADLVILVGVKSLSDLEHIYYGYEELYERAPLINIQANPGRTGMIEVHTSADESISECVAQLLLQSEFGVTEETATSLLRGIEHATQYFTSMSATADTFETAAKLMRTGASRSRPTITSTQQKPFVSEYKKKEPKPGEIAINTKNNNKKLGNTDQPGSLKFTPNPGAPRGG